MDAAAGAVHAGTAPTAPCGKTAGAGRMANPINVYENRSIIGGLPRPCLTGPGRYSIERG